MFRIKKKPSRRPPLIAAPRQDPALPVQLTRAFLYSLRHTHAWKQLVLDAYHAMPSEWRPSYKRWADLEIHPTFDELMQLIEEALRQGVLTLDEAAALRAGKPIALHFPSDESQPVLSTQATSSPTLPVASSGDAADA